jgi:hypothetical protein
MSIPNANLSEARSQLKQTFGIRRNSVQSPKNIKEIREMDMEFTSSNEDTDSKERKIFGFENKTDDNSHSDSYDSCEYSKLGMAPEDSCNTVLICFAMLGFVAWFPCY